MFVEGSPQCQCEIKNCKSFQHVTKVHVNEFII